LAVRAEAHADLRYTTAFGLLGDTKQDPDDAASFRLLRFSFVSIKILAPTLIRNTP
jgi:hypothetical protein